MIYSGDKRIPEDLDEAMMLFLVMAGNPNADEVMAEWRKFESAARKHFVGLDKIRRVARRMGMSPNGTGMEKVVGAEMGKAPLRRMMDALRPCAEPPLDRAFFEARAEVAKTLHAERDGLVVAPEERPWTRRRMEDLLDAAYDRGTTTKRVAMRGEQYDDLRRDPDMLAEVLLSAPCEDYPGARGGVGVEIIPGHVDLADRRAVVEFLKSRDRAKNGNPR